MQRKRIHRSIVKSCLMYYLDNPAILKSEDEDMNGQWTMYDSSQEQYVSTTLLDKKVCSGKGYNCLVKQFSDMCIDKHERKKRKKQKEGEENDYYKRRKRFTTEDVCHTLVSTQSSLSLHAYHDINSSRANGNIEGFTCTITS